VSALCLARFTTLAFIERALDRIRAGDNGATELHNVRA
jgi:hypothetical protein